MQTRDDMILSETEGAFISVVILAIMNGIHLVTFLVCLRWQIYSDEDWKIRRGTGLLPLIIATILVFAFSIINFGICLGSFLLAMRGNNNLTLASVLTVRIRRFKSIVVHNQLQSLSDALIVLESMIADCALVRGPVLSWILVHQSLSDLPMLDCLPQTVDYSATRYPIAIQLLHHHLSLVLEFSQGRGNTNLAVHANDPMETSTSSSRRLCLRYRCGQLVRDM